VHHDRSPGASRRRAARGPDLAGVLHVPRGDAGRPAEHDDRQVPADAGEAPGHARPASPERPGSPQGLRDRARRQGRAAGVGRRDDQEAPRGPRVRRPPARRGGGQSVGVRGLHAQPRHIAPGDGGRARLLRALGQADGARVQADERDHVRSSGCRAVGRRSLETALMVWCMCLVALRRDFDGRIPCIKKK